jgi:DNA-binding SARP family transcriptional activator
MARAAVKAKQAERAKAAPAKARPHGRRKHAAGGNPNQQLFFMKLRRKAKWIYVLLAVLFAITFAFLGVGSGSGSGGLDQLFNNINIFGHGGGPSVSKAQKEVAKAPSEAKGYRDLATAYEAKGDTNGAISALQQYTNIKRKDAKAWSELAGLETSQAQSYLADYQNAYQILQLAAPSQAFYPTGKLATALGTDPIENAQRTSVQTSVNDLQQKVQLAYNGTVSSWQQVTTLQPKNADSWFQLAQAAQTSGDTATAIKAYKKYLALNPTSSSAAQIRQLIKQLGPAPAPPAKKKK